MENEPVFELDRRIFLAVYGGADHGALAFVMVALTVLGSGWSMIGLVPLLVISRTRRVAIALVLTLAGTSGLVFALKLAFARVRPLHALEGVRGLFDAPTDFSFPSGHAAGGFAFAAFVTTLLLVRPRTARTLPVAAGLFVLAAGIAMSRVYLGCHFPGDVLAGSLVGLGTGVAGGRLYTFRRAADPP